MNFLVRLFVVPPLVAKVASDCWGWFVVPLGLPDVGMVHALGLIFSVQLLLGSIHRATGRIERSQAIKPQGRQAEHTDTVERTLGAVLGPLVVWGCAALCAYGMGA